MNNLLLVMMFRPVVTGSIKVIFSVVEVVMGFIAVGNVGVVGGGGGCGEVFVVVGGTDGAKGVVESGFGVVDVVVAFEVKRTSCSAPRTAALSCSSSFS